MQLAVIESAQERGKAQMVLVGQTLTAASASRAASGCATVGGALSAGAAPTTLMTETEEAYAWLRSLYNSNTPANFGAVFSRFVAPALAKPPQAA